MATQTAQTAKVQQKTASNGKEYTFVENYKWFKLNNGQSMPGVGYGTGLVEHDAVISPTEQAIRAGYRYIDTANEYQNEVEIGKAVKNILAEGVLKREDLFLLSKLEDNEHNPEDVKKACERSMRDLGVSYLDMYLIHWPVVADCKGDVLTPPLHETWKAMEALVDEGLVRSIGISNFSVKKTKELLPHCRIKPALSQFEVNPIWRNDALVNFCQEQGIHVCAYAPLSTPGSTGMPIRLEGVPNALENPLVKQLAEKYGKQPAQILIRWLLQRGISSPPKTVHPEYIKANLDVFDWELEEADFKALSSLEPQHRVMGGRQKLSKDGPYKTPQDLWDDVM